ncbi:MAG: hypothetical protein JXR77_01695 [Lentisphaeria bacterium]|nr:hypothetical protein [Lentisphaeria bacterium]
MAGNRHSGILLVLGLAAALAATVALIVFRAPRAEPQPAPDATLDFRRFASPEFPLNQGLALVVFLSADCSHCMETARYVAGLDTEEHGTRVYFVILGEPAEIDSLLHTLGAQLPYCVATPLDYAEFAGDDPPTLYLLRDGRPEARWPGSIFHVDLLHEAQNRKR